MSATAWPGIDWKTTGGDAWAEVQAMMDRSNRPVTEAVIARAAPQAGERVLDVGCGGGGTTLAAARRVGPSGAALGVDLSATLIAMAREAARTEGLDQAAFVEADGQVYDFPQGPFDVLVSRYGVMFFADAKAAFANLHKAMRPSGRLAFACWRSPAENPFAGLPMQAVGDLVPKPPPPTPNAPGRFGFADPDHVRDVLQAAGWRDVEIEPLDAPTPSSLEEMMLLSLKLGPLGQSLREQTEEVRLKAEAAVREALQARMEGGVIPVAAACWLVSARA